MEEIILSQNPANDELVVRENDNNEGNQNSNHSVESADSDKLNPILMPKRSKKGVKKGKHSRAEKKQETNSQENLNDSVDGTLTETIQYEEDGNLISMEINDGGAVAREFLSDGEISSESNSEDENTEEERDSSSSKTKEEVVTDSEVTEAIHKRKDKPRKRKSMEEKLDTLSSMVMAMQDMIKKSGILDPKEPKPKENNGKRKGKLTPKKGREITDNPVDISNSETTIYQNVLDKSRHEDVMVDSEITFKLKESQIDDRWGSSSSDDCVDTSAVLLEVDINDKFIADCVAAASRRAKSVERPTPRMDPANEIIREAEACRMKMFPVKGNPNHHSIIDENYVSIGLHVDAGLHAKIKEGEFVDFSRLLPKDKPSTEDHRMELVIKGGQTFFVPVADCELTGITNFS